MSESPRIVPVQINGQQYPIRSSLEPQYVQELAAYVEEKIRAAAAATPAAGDSLRVAILAALNIADEFFRCQSTGRARQGELAERAAELEELLDRALAS